MPAVRRPHDRFSSQGAFLLAGLGMTLGTGNVWRFPQLVAQEGGAFLLAWAAGLVLWSFPLLLGEASIGVRARLSPVGAFARLGGGRSAWMGTTLVVTAFGILCFNAVASGACLHYLVRAITRDLLADPSRFSLGHHEFVWGQFKASWEAVPFHLLVLALAWLAVSRKGVKGIDWLHRIAVPAIFAILFVLAIRGLTLPGARAALHDIFRLDRGRLLDPQLWLLGLYQAAWSTAAGWGWYLTYSGSAPPGTSRLRTTAALVGGTAIASLLAAGALLPLAHGPEVPAEIQRALTEGTRGFVFVWVPSLLGSVPWGEVVAVLLYAAVAAAALLPVVILLEVVVRTAVDMGADRFQVSAALALTAAVFGLPAALSTDVQTLEIRIFGTLLVVGGALTVGSIRRFGPERLYREVITAGGPEPGARVFGFAFRWILPVLAAVLLVGHVGLGVVGSAGLEGLFTPTGPGTAIAGALAMIGLARACTPEFVRRTFAPDVERPPAPEPRPLDAGPPADG